ncbi:uncharacterized protein V6R79_003288 [Siganus canaliculatus]
MGPKQALLGMNVIGAVWETVTGGGHPGLQVFRSIVPAPSHREWDRAFACCQRAMMVGPTEDQPIMARLTKQQPVVVPPETEMLLWTQVPGNDGKTTYTALVEGTDVETDWQVAHAVVEVVKNKLPIRVCNPHPYSIEIPQRQPLAKVCRLTPDQIHANELALQEQEDGELTVVVRAVQELAEDSTAGGLPQCPHLPLTQQDQEPQSLTMAVRTEETTDGLQSWKSRQQEDPTLRLGEGRPSLEARGGKRTNRGTRTDRGAPRLEEAGVEGVP